MTKQPQQPYCPHHTILEKMNDIESRTLWTLFSEKIICSTAEPYAATQLHVDKLILKDSSSKELARTIISMGKFEKIIFMELNEFNERPSLAINLMLEDLYKKGKSPKQILERNSEFLSVVTEGSKAGELFVFFLELF